MAVSRKSWDLYAKAHRYYPESDELNEALFWYNKAIKEDPKNWGALNNKGVILSMKGKKKLALKYFKLALKHSPTYWKKIPWKKLIKTNVDGLEQSSKN